MDTSTPPIEPKTVMLVLTVDGDTIIASPADGTPRVVRSFEQLVELVRDPSVAAVKSTAAGFDVGDFFRGLGRMVVDYGAPDPAKNGEQQR